ncbi:MAG: GlsB/YeaQ/YmgE family stress response membrane protein [Oscillospiraceae bacterium]
MGIIGWIIIGALSGWIASKFTGNDRQMGGWSNIVVGIIGGFLGGLIMNLVGGEGITGFNVWSLLVSIGGSVLLLLVVNAFRSSGSSSKRSS